jgi:hypothetical protein
MIKGVLLRINEKGVVHYQSMNYTHISITVRQSLRHCTSTHLGLY